MKLLNDNGLLVLADQNCCCGYLLVSPVHGVFEPNIGKIDVSQAEAETHNKLLSEAEIAGLDNCKLGEQGCLYMTEEKGKVTAVKTYTGTIVSTEVKESGNKRRSIIFKRNGKVFKGIKPTESDLFGFKRIE